MLFRKLVSIARSYADVCAATHDIRHWQPRLQKGLNDMTVHWEAHNLKPSQRRFTFLATKFQRLFSYMEHGWKHGTIDYELLKISFIRLQNELFEEVQKYPLQGKSIALWTGRDAQAVAAADVDSFGVNNIPIFHFLSGLWDRMYSDVPPPRDSFASQVNSIFSMVFLRLFESPTEIKFFLSNSNTDRFSYWRVNSLTWALELPYIRSVMHQVPVSFYYVKEGTVTRVPFEQLSVNRRLDDDLVPVRAVSISRLRDILTRWRCYKRTGR